MGTSAATISGWFDEGVRDGKAYMIVWCDTYDWDDYPSYHDTKDAALLDKASNGTNMKRLMEIYDLKGDKASQMSQRRAMAL